jgi:hypothetical protein
MALTSKDWLARAQAAEVPEVREQALAQAERLARYASDWVEVVRAWIEAFGAGHPRVAEVLELAKGVAFADSEAHALMDLARIEFEQLGDRAAAEATMDAARAQVAPRSLDSLARGELYLTGDRARVVAHLDAGDRGARRVGDRIGLATARFSLLEDRDGAVARLRAIETGADSLDGHVWSLLNAWVELGELDHGLALLEGAISASTACGTATTLARAAHCHDLDEATARALDRASGLATDFKGWLDVAETEHETRGEAPRVAAALERALAAADPDDLPKLAMAFRRLLQDEARAAAISPVGMRPDALRANERSLPGFPVSASALFDRLRAQMTDARLEAVARSDYGMGFEQHLRTLRELCTQGLVPRELEYHPVEVVSLTRWSDGEDVDHVSRALCCVLLCLSESTFGLESKVPHLVESCIALGAEATAEGEALLAWLHTTGQYDEDRWMDLWGLALLRASHDPGHRWADDLTDALRQVALWQTDPPTEAARSGVHGAKWEALTEQWIWPRAGDPSVAALLQALGLDVPAARERGQAPEEGSGPERGWVRARRLYSLAIGGPSELPVPLGLSERHFVCLLAWDARGVPAEAVASLVSSLLRAGATYFVCWGPDCERVRDIIDELVSHPDNDFGVPEDSCIMTTWHDGECLADALWFFLVNAWPDEHYQRSTQAALAISVGSPAWAEEIGKALAHPREFVASGT